MNFLFLSTPSARRATSRTSEICRMMDDFYPRPPRGGRLRARLGGKSINIFLSTPSARRATPAKRLGGSVPKNFYPRPPRGGRQTPIAIAAAIANFYPRPPRGGRRSSSRKLLLHLVISIHALREEGDGELSQVCGLDHDFYPRPPRGGRLKSRQSLIDYQDFYPRPPRGGRRPCHRWRFRGSPISIHALREEGDVVILLFIFPKVDFYPRPPRGGRRVHAGVGCVIVGFLSTPSARRATRGGVGFMLFK